MATQTKFTPVIQVTPPSRTGNTAVDTALTQLATQVTNPLLAAVQELQAAVNALQASSTTSSGSP